MVEDYLYGVQQFLAGANTDGHGTNGGFGLEPAIRQYGVWGAWFSGQCAVDHGHIPTKPIAFNQSAGNTVINTEIAWAQQNLGLAAFDSETIVLVFTKGIAYDSNYSTHGCAYHNHFAANKYFGVIPWAATTFCAQGNAQNEFQILASHELFESASDPMGNGWFATGDPLKDGGGEIADGCPGSALTFDDGTTGMISQVTDDVSGYCQLWSPEQIIGMTAVKTGSNTINLVTAHGQGGVSVYSGDGTSAWTLTANLGGVITDSPAVISADGRTMDVFVRGTYGALYRQFFDGTSWSGWQNLGGYWVGPPAAAFRTSAGKYVFVRGYDGNIYYYRDGANNTIVFQGQIQIGPSGTVRAVTPPQTFAIDNDCFSLFVNASDGFIWVEQFCSEIPILVQQVASNGPKLVSSFSRSRSILDVIINGPIIGNLTIMPVSGLGAQVPYEMIWHNGGSPTKVTVGTSFVGPTSAVALGPAGGLWVGRSPGGATGFPLFATSSDSVRWSAFNALDGNVAMVGAPYVFSADGVTADVFMAGTGGALQHKRFNGTSWLATQKIPITIQ